MQNLLVVVVSFVTGLIFGIGVIISGMVNPAKILSFFDVAGGWDPSLALVMASGLAVTFIGYRILHENYQPILSSEYLMPTATDIDSRLLLGAGLFGLGWGLAGLCPGPALAALMYGGQSIGMFVVSMLIGMVGAKFVNGSYRKTKIA